MLKTIALGLATAATLSLGAAAVTPAFANYAHCLEQPDASDCQKPSTPKVGPTLGVFFACYNLT